MFRGFFGKKITVPFLDSIRMPVVITYRDGRVMEANDAFCRLIGTVRGDLEGKDCSRTEPMSSLCNTIAASVLKGKTKRQRIKYEGLTLEADVTPVMSGETVDYICIAFNDVTAFVRLEADFQRKSNEMIITNTLASAFISSENIENVYSDLLEKALVISNFDVGLMVLKYSEGLQLKSAVGISPKTKGLISDGMLDHVFMTALESGEPLYVIESKEALELVELKDEGISFMAVIPLRVGIEHIGCMALASRVPKELDFDLASLLSLIGNNVSLISDKIRLFMEAERLAITDALTGLYNVRYFYETLEKEISRTERYSDPFSLVLFDIDDFKALNDAHGHQAGDDVLRSVSDVMRRASRKTDVVARYGGEEFIAVLPNTPKDEAFKLACRMKDAVEAHSHLAYGHTSITLSGGVATFPDDAQDAKSLLYAADMAMYGAKAAGKKRVRCYGSDT